MGDKGNVMVLTKEEIESVITIEDAISAVEEGFKAYNSGRTVTPFPVALQIPDHKGDIHIKPGYINGYETYCVKIASGFYEKDPASIHGMLLLFDSRTGEPLCFEVDRGYITDLRTAAAGAVAARALAKKKVKRVSIIGTGTQARLQIQALSKVRDFEELLVWGRNPDKVERYIKEMSGLIHARIRAAGNPKEAVAGADIIVTATMSTIPLLKGKWISRGAHITAMGSDSPEKQELGTEVLTSADKVVCDSIKQCAMLGEVHHAIEDGSMKEGDVHAELGEVLLGKKRGRENDEEITVCDLTGLAVQDVVTAQIVYDRAVKKGIGSKITV